MGLVMGLLWAVPQSYYPGMSEAEKDFLGLEGALHHLLDVGVFVVMLVFLLVGLVWWGLGLKTKRDKALRKASEDHAKWVATLPAAERAEWAAAAEWVRAGKTQVTDWLDEMAEAAGPDGAEVLEERRAERALVAQAEWAAGAEARAEMAERARAAQAEAAEAEAAVEAQSAACQPSAEYRHGVAMWGDAAEASGKAKGPGKNR